MLVLPALRSNPPAPRSNQPAARTRLPPPMLVLPPLMLVQPPAMLVQPPAKLVRPPAKLVRPPAMLVRPPAMLNPPSLKSKQSAPRWRVPAHIARPSPPMLVLSLRMVALSDPIVARYLPVMVLTGPVGVWN